jgi:predicted Zn-ribbon and HTH transcriptional regulator
MSRRENSGNSGNSGNSASGIYYDSEIRGYSRRHSYYDDAFNMDFEYSYLDLMSSFGRFVSRTHEMYSNMETCVSTMIELQNERRRLLNRRREHLHNNRDLHEQRHVVGNGDAVGTQERSGAGIGGLFTGTTTGTAGTTAPSLPRSPLFDIGNVFYSIPRTVLLNPNTNTNTNTTALNRRRNGGLTISEIEENTEIMTYGSIPSNYILNTECPITRETFTPESVVLTLKQCKHCFVPFRMMTWLETNSTCPLCRSNVVRPVETPQMAAPDSNQDDARDARDARDANDANDDSQNPDNISISNIFNTLMQNSNNEFDNLSVDNVNDNSIMFSFDLPRSQVNSQNTNSETSIIPQIERLLTNTLSRSIGNSTSRTNATPPDSSTSSSRHDTNDDNNYPEVD